MQGDQLSIWLFLWGTAVAFGLAALTLVDSNRTFLVRGLWTTASVFLIAALALPVVLDFWPALKTEIEKFTPNSAAFYVLGLSIFALLVIDFRRGRRSKFETPRLPVQSSVTPTPPSSSSIRQEVTFAEENDDLYGHMKALYETRYNGKADFYHYSGTRIHTFVSMLFKNGFTIRLFVECPDTAHSLGCDFQQQRINSMIAQFMNELPAPASGTKGQIEIYQSTAPLTVRAALLDDQHIVLGWYVYEMLKMPTKGFPNDKIAVWGHEGWGLVIDNLHPQFRFARRFIEKYEQRIRATKVWSHPDSGQSRT